MRPIHPTYHKLLNNIPQIKRCFDVEFLTLPDKKFKLVRFSKNVSDKSPLLILMAGCHGEEPAPPLAIFRNYRHISEVAEKCFVNLIIYPLVNPYGYNRNERYNQEGLNCNSNWIHKDKRPIASNVKIISRDIRKFKPRVFANLHEDDETKNEFYIFSFGDRKYEEPLLQVGKKYFPIAKDSLVRDATFDKPKVYVKGGVVFDDHDGSAEDFMFHQGVEFSCCTETPSDQPISKRIKCNTDLIVKLIELTKEFTAKEKLEIVPQ